MEPLAVLLPVQPAAHAANRQKSAEATAASGDAFRETAAEVSKSADSPARAENDSSVQQKPTSGPRVHDETGEEIDGDAALRDATSPLYGVAEPFTENFEPLQNGLAADEDGSNVLSGATRTQTSLLKSPKATGFATELTTGANNGTALSTAPTNGQAQDEYSSVNVLDQNLSDSAVENDSIIDPEAPTQTPAHEVRMHAQNQSVQEMVLGTAARALKPVDKTQADPSMAISTPAQEVGKNRQFYSMLTTEIKTPANQYAMQNPVLTIIETIRHKSGFELRLDPPDLGRVTIEFVSADNKIIRAIVSADHPSTLDLARRHADTLMRKLEKHGLSGFDLQFSDQRDADSTRRTRPEIFAVEAPAGWAETAPEAISPLMRIIANDRYDRFV